MFNLYFNFVMMLFHLSHNLMIDKALDSYCFTVWHLHSSAPAERNVAREINLIYENDDATKSNLQTLHSYTSKKKNIRK